MKRLIEYMVLVGLVTACLFAGSPTFLSPSSVKATIEGVVLFPSITNMLSITQVLYQGKNNDKMT